MLQLLKVYEFIHSSNTFNHVYVILICKQLAMYICIYYCIDQGRAIAVSNAWLLFIASSNMNSNIQLMLGVFVI